MEQAVFDFLCQELEKGISTNTLSLPMLSKVTQQVMSLVNDQDSDAAALSQLIQGDPALAGHVMRIANSAAYSPNAKMTSLQQAIARLGMSNIAEIAMAATMGPKMFQTKGFELLVKQIWESSIAIAVWGKEIARQGRRNVESTFLCGLLFQIGRPVVLQAVLEISEKNAIVVDIETLNVLMDKYQTVVGNNLAVHWHLPIAVSHVINGIETDKPAEGSQDIVDAIKAARVFSHTTLSDRNYDAEILSANPYVIENNLYSDDVLKLLDKAGSVHDTIGALAL
ncbi:MAG: HD-like signal output (HDOD) protein [Oceanicoccus sp.]|jgi:HD-like signal output (HDOD) protein